MHSKTVELDHMLQTSVQRTYNPMS